MAVLLESSQKLSPMSATGYSERPISRDKITGRIAKRSIRLLLQEEGFHHQDILDLIDPRSPTVEERGEELELVEKAADRVRQLIKDPNQPKPPSLADLASQRWIIHAGNVHSEYTHVAQQLFSDGVNWGRVIAFLGFSATYCLYAIQQGVQESIVESVTAWAVLFLEQELRDWFRQHSWVSGDCLEECTIYSIKAIRNIRVSSTYLYVELWLVCVVDTSDISCSVI